MKVLTPIGGVLSPDVLMQVLVVPDQDVMMSTYK